MNRPYTPKPRPCRQCGKGFLPNSGGNAYCSPWCRLLFNSAQGENGCIVWTGGIAPSGYGVTSAVKDGRTVTISPHRLSWEIHNGRIPHGLSVLHSCDNRPCFNPAHLRVGTQAENMDDKRARGRGLMGERNPLARLTEGEAIAIMAELKKPRAERLTQVQIAAKYSVSQSMVSCIKLGKAWKWLIDPSPEKQRCPTCGSAIPS